MGMLLTLKLVLTHEMFLPFTLDKYLWNIFHALYLTVSLFTEFDVFEF